MKAYKGFTPQSDGTRKCRDKIYEVGETYEEASAVPCSSGMHACLSPLDAFSHYPPATSVYHEVEVADDAKGDGMDSKVASRTLKMGAEVGITGLVRAQIEYTTSRAINGEGDHSTGDYGAASSTGYQGAASSTGYQGAASATGYQSAASATGDQSAASATGSRGAASSTGRHSVALAGGYQGRARGSKGSALMLVERSWTGGILHAQAVIVGKESNGNRIKPNVYYTLVDGKVVEAADQS